MYIPTRFKMMGMDYTVQELPVNRREDLHGEHVPADSIILLDPSLRQQKLHATFYHEWIHAALEAAGRDDLSENETLVDTLGSLLHQFMRTKKGKFPPIAGTPPVQKA